MSFFIHGIDAVVPPHAITQAEATATAHRVVCQDEQQQRLLTVLYRRSGVKTRHSVMPHQRTLNWPPAEEDDSCGGIATATLGPSTAERMRYYSEHASPLALEAARGALNDAKIDADALTHLVTVSCTGFETPGVDVALIEGLELRPTTQRVHIGFMGCQGVVNGLRAAHAIATADPSAHVLLCSVELCSLHYRFAWDPERLVGNAIFADGAAAIVGSGGPLAASAVKPWSIESTGSCLVPDSTDAMSWRVGDHGFEVGLDARVPELIQQNLRSWMDGWLDQNGLSVESVGSWAVHPGGPRILDAVEAALGLPPEATALSRETLANFGNMSSPTVLFILKQLRLQNAPRPCVALGFGPGLFAEAALIR